MTRISSLLLTLFTLLSASFVLPAKAFSITPASRVVAVADDGDEGDDGEEPYVEPPFTVYINIDNPEAVYMTVNDRPISHAAGVNAVTVDPGDGYIKAYVNDGYAFTRFYDVEKDVDALQYSVQTAPVTIRKYRGTGDGDPMIFDGDTFIVETTDMTAAGEYALTVIVDNASKVDLRIGASLDMTSGANRRIPLVDGENTVTYTSLDSYLHISGNSWMTQLSSVTLDGKNMPYVEEGVSKIYSMQLKGSKTAGKVIEIVAETQQTADKFAMTLTTNDPEAIKYFSRMPEDKNIPVADCESTITFNQGDYFDVYTYETPLSFTINDEPVAYSAGESCYHLYPTAGAKVEIIFKRNVSVSGIDADSPMPAAIYTTGGYRLPTTDINALTPGIYITPKGKILVK